MSDQPVPAYWLYGERRDGRFPDALHIETIKERSAVYDWRIQPHRHHDMFQFLTVEKGGGRTRVDGQSTALAPGSAVFLPPLVVHEFRFDAGTNGFVASVAKGTMKRVLSSEPGVGAALSRPAVMRLAPSNSDWKLLAAQMRAALAEFATSRTCRDTALGAHAELLAIWFARTIHAHAAAKKPEKHPHAALVRRFVELVEASFHQHRPLTEYAETLGVSVAHLTRTCRQIVGRTAVQVVHDRLMIEARRDLVYSAMTISQIAFRLGFSDPAYFSRFFSKAVGVAPSAYRANV
jgi:AraC family transcriptional activator of pobA